MAKEKSKVNPSTSLRTRNKKSKVKTSVDVSSPSSAPQSPSSQKEPQTMDELLAATGYELKGFKRGEEVTGVILQKTGKELIIDTGGKSYGVVPSREVEAIADLVSQLQVGEQVTASVIMPENEHGQVLLSLRKTSQEKRWSLLTEAMEQNKEIDVTGVDVAKGGMLIDFSGVRGFIPASQLDPLSANNPALLRGKKIAVKILELDRASNRFVVSQKAVTQKELVAEQQKVISKIKLGDTYEAVVTGIVPFGAFVQVSIPTEADGEEKAVQIEGLIHISEIAWERVDNPGDYLKVGQTLKVKVIGIDLENGKLNLSIKQLSIDPWLEASKKYTQDQVVKGKVTRTSHFGVFVQLEPGVEGLIHISKMPPSFAPKVGDTITASIESVDLEKRKLSLSVVTTEKPIGYR